MNIASDSPGANQWVRIATDAQQQMLQIAAALDATLLVLGLNPGHVERAREIAERLRKEAEHEEDESRRLRGLALPLTRVRRAVL